MDSAGGRIYRFRTAGDDILILVHSVKEVYGKAPNIVLKGYLKRFTAARHRNTGADRGLFGKNFV